MCESSKTVLRTQFKISHIQLSERVVYHHNYSASLIAPLQNARHQIHRQHIFYSPDFMFVVLCWPSFEESRYGPTTDAMRPIHFSSQPRIQHVTARASEPNSFIEFIIYFKNCDVFSLNPDAFYFYRLSLLLLFIINWRF